MKKFFIALLICFSLVCPFNQAYSADKKTTHLFKSRTQTEKGYLSRVYSVAKFVTCYEQYANNYNYDSFMAMYAPEYVSSDGFDLNILSKTLKETWKIYPGIKYSVRLNSVTFDKDKAIVNVTETAKGFARTENNRIGDFTSTTEDIYYLKPSGDSWLITADYTLAENINLVWGDAKSSKVSLETPTQAKANQQYSAILNVNTPDGVLAIGSISADKITFPQKPSKEIYRKLSIDGSLERIMTTNSDNTNEYVVATVGFTRPRIDANRNININLSGYACVMNRVNVIPENKFIEVSNESQAK